MRKGDYVAINKPRLFGLLEIHYAQSKGGILPDVKKKIDEAGRIGALELGRGYQTPEGLRGWLLGG